MVNLTTRRKRSVDAGTLAAVRDFCTWAVGVKIQWDRLDDGEAADLVRLVKKADLGPGASGLDWDALTKNETKKFERLLAQGAGMDPDHFDKAREEARMLREMAALGAEARRATTLRREAEVDWFRAMYRHLESGHLWMQHLAVLTFVLVQMHAGKAIAHGARIEGEGDQMRLVYSGHFGMFGPADPEGTLAATWTLEWLVEQGWLVLEPRGMERRIGLGPKTRRALRSEEARR
jgi:hypothetical protein